VEIMWIAVEILAAQYPGETAHNKWAKGACSTSCIALLPTRGQASFRWKGDSGRADPDLGA
jgi:hypothetical protein